MKITHRMRNEHYKTALTRYATAIFAVAMALLLTRWLKAFGDAGISPPFFAAVLLSAWFGGLGSGLVATLLSGVVSAYLLMSPHATDVSVVGEVVLRPLVFTLVAVLASSLHAATRRAAEEADRAKRAAEIANEAKSRFLAMVSHELRTPLSPIVMLAEMLADDPLLPSHLRPDVESIRQHVDIELRLIDDLVDLTRISSGKMKLRLEPVGIHQPLRAAIRVCEVDLPGKGLQLTTSFSAADPIVQGDPVRLQQVFWNLLRNAIKFTPERGRITVTTHCTRSPEGPEVEIQIADTGIGIEPDRLTAIFRAFEQADASISKHFGGLGLGLAICQGLIEGHGGTITANSPGRNHGATFTIRLPISLESSAADPQHLSGTTTAT